MDEAKTLITFLRRCKKFADDNTFTQDLIVEGDTTIMDLKHILHSNVGGIIAGIQNDVSEIKSALVDYYTKEGNMKMVEKLLKI